MNRLAVRDAGPAADRTQATWILPMAILLATLAEAIASSALSLSRNDVMGATYATPDEFAWLDINYASAKLLAFIASPWLLSRVAPRRLLLAATLVLGIGCGASAVISDLRPLIGFRAMQGLAGGTLLVAGQSLLFLAYPRRSQPLVQAVFAFGSVVAPATIAPALQGWLLDNRSWIWIFFSAVPLSLASAGLAAMCGDTVGPIGVRRPFDWGGCLLLGLLLVCATYVLSQGNRWDWFDDPNILLVTAIATASLLALLGHQIAMPRDHLLSYAAFRNPDFAFSFLASFVAGCALFGSAYVIPAFAVSVLAFTPTAAGQLLLPSGILFVGSLLTAAALFRTGRVPPIITVPFGIGLMVLSMWMLSGSTSQSGTASMMAAILLRGLGLGFLFLSITLIAFGSLPTKDLTTGIGLFNAGRQVGGLFGVAALQTLIDHQSAISRVALSARISGNAQDVGQRIAGVRNHLLGQGMEASEAGRAALKLLAGAVQGQSHVIAFNDAFLAIAVFFVAAAPCLVAVKVTLAKIRRNTPTPAAHQA